MKNQWLTFVEAADALVAAEVLVQVRDAGFSDVAFTQTSDRFALAASCNHCHRDVRARIWILPSTDPSSGSLMNATADRVRRLPPSRDTAVVLEHLRTSNLIVATETGGVCHDCDCDYRLHISFGRLGQYMSYVDDRGFSDEVEQYLEFEPE